MGNNSSPELSCIQPLQSASQLHQDACLDGDSVLRIPDKGNIVASRDFDEKDHDGVVMVDDQTISVAQAECDLWDQVAVYDATSSRFAEWQAMFLLAGTESKSSVVQKLVSRCCVGEDEEMTRATKRRRVSHQGTNMAKKAACLHPTHAWAEANRQVYRILQDRLPQAFAQYTLQSPPVQMDDEDCGFHLYNALKSYYTHGPGCTQRIACIEGQVEKMANQPFSESRGSWDDKMMPIQELLNEWSALKCDKEEYDYCRLAYLLIQSMEDSSPSWAPCYAPLSARYVDCPCSFNVGKDDFFRALRAMASSVKDQCRGLAVVD